MDCLQFIYNITQLDGGMLRDTPGGVSLHSGGGFQHIFDENSVPSRWVIHQHMGHGSHQFSVLNNRRAAHE